MAVAEREAWKNAILEKFKDGKWYDVLYLMALNYGERGSIQDMIKQHCENADPVENWQAFI